MADNEVTVRIVTETDTTQLDDMKSSIDEMQSGADSASTSVDKLGDSAANVDGSQISDAGSSADELGNAADQADTEVQELQNSLGLIEASALLGAADQISSLGASAESLTQDMNTAAISVGQLATQTGIAEPQMVSLINNISNATFPNEEAMMYVKSLDQIGVASGNLGQSATDLDKINDAFGLGANKVNSLGQELSVLGVDMNNVSSSFNALAYANANTVGGMDNYYTFLKKYDAQFKELGFNVDQASVIIAAATQKFGGGRAALSGLNEALKESNGDTRALEQALGLQAGALDNASQLTGQYEGQLQQLADEEAEHKSILDQMNAAWEDMSLALSPILSPLGSFMGLIGQAGSWAVGVNGLIKLAETFGILGKVTSVIGSVGSALSSLWGIIIANPIILVVVAVAALILALIWAYNNVEWFREMVDNAWASIQGFAGWISGAFTDAINGIGNAFNNAGQIIQSSIQGMVDFVMQTLQGLYNYIMTLGGLIPEGLNITGNQIIDSIMAIMLFISTLPLQLSIIFINIIASTLGFGDNFVQTMITSASDAVNGFIQWISQLPSTLSSFLSNATSSAVSFASSFVNTIVNAASDAVNGFVSWISQMPQRLAEELNEMIQQALDFAARLPQIIGEAAANMVGSWVGGSGESSPGFMYDAFYGELKEMGKISTAFSKSLPATMMYTGSEMVRNFNPNLDSDKGSVIGGGNTYNITLEIGSVDKRERVNEIIEAIRDYIEWDNTTAGRTV